MPKYSNEMQIARPNGNGPCRPYITSLILVLTSSPLPPPPSPHSIRVIPVKLEIWPQPKFKVELEIPIASDIRVKFRIAALPFTSYYIHFRPTPPPPAPTQSPMRPGWNQRHLWAETAMGMISLPPPAPRPAQLLAELATVWDRVRPAI